jgi:two-component system, NtrC family, C4-dicarboxylate transport response regulator DctD
MPVHEAILIEDEEGVRLATMQTLELGGFIVHAFSSAEQALPSISPDFAGVVITDVRLTGKSGLDVLAQVVAIDPHLPVIIITGHGDVSLAVEVMRAGAYDFIEKPFSADRLMEAVNRAQEKRHLFLDNLRLKAAWASHADIPPLIGTSSRMEHVKTLIRSVGPTSVDVLINGQTGTGKEVVARHLHLASGRSGQFVAINCGALPETIFESEIFGHEAGAFTGAQKRRIGKLEYANGGTVFLDEIESMPLSLQVKLLRVLQERRLERLGGNQAIPIDCRIIAASKIDLLQLSAQGQFREDLYYRISVVSIDLPSLAERQEDIPLLFSHFVQGAALRYQREVPQWTVQQMAGWQMNGWPGNVRELRNFVDRLVLGVPDGRQDTGLFDPGADVAPKRLPAQVETYERKLIAEALKITQGNVAAAAERLGVPKKTLYDKIKKAHLSDTVTGPEIPGSADQAPQSF